MFAHLEKMDVEYYNEHKTGDLMTRFTSDLNAIRMAIGPAVICVFDYLIGIFVPDGAVQGQTVDFPLVITDNADLLLEGVIGFNAAAYGLLHGVQRSADFRDPCYRPHAPLPRIQGDGRTAQERLPWKLP